MSPIVEAEVVSGQVAEEGVRLSHVRALGIVGTVLALATMFAAFGFGVLFLFGTTLVASAAATLLWNAVFSPEFSTWVFGTPHAPFWKLFLLFLAAGIAVRLIRPWSVKRF